MILPYSENSNEIWKSAILICPWQFYSAGGTKNPTRYIFIIWMALDISLSHCDWL